jgi:hypothetical protein
LWRGRQVAWVIGPRPKRKNWAQLSEIFVEIEKQEHAAELARHNSPNER